MFQKGEGGSEWIQDDRRFGSDGDTLLLSMFEGDGEGALVVEAVP